MLQRPIKGNAYLGLRNTKCSQGPQKCSGVAQQQGQEGDSSTGLDKAGSRVKAQSRGLQTGEHLHTQVHIYLLSEAQTLQKFLTV